MSSSMVGGLSHILWKIKFMFQTTNQIPIGLIVSPRGCWPGRSGTLRLRLSRNGNSIRPHFKRCTIPFRKPLAHGALCVWRGQKIQATQSGHWLSPVFGLMTVQWTNGYRSAMPSGRVFPGAHILLVDPSTFLGSVWGMIWRVKYLLPSNPNSSFFAQTVTIRIFPSNWDCPICIIICNIYIHIYMYMYCNGSNLQSW